MSGKIGMRVVEVGPSFLRKKIGEGGLVKRNMGIIADVDKGGFVTVVMKMEDAMFISVFYAGTIERAWMILNL